ncbi:uncharacterized protein MYCFIDRAFT_180415 [Pseudocercospora fijiensis CIRAD86]|uniref:Uncharacterized protein n=1 Tax=Pseudocercospora fijiensis (strain CIRAD86) TaxID=383855 RepID=M3AHU0_PSEFD|nr:uncharacterized protein MYCFIDRAFT_180415 [Pseudocercospora fijiensis CIRAD86]EME77082.1 hypothetical protein MYCFIDRAFT_180415 [Pseudocercospora fijiensis CIRAD86]
MSDDGEAAVGDASSHQAIKPWTSFKQLRISSNAQSAVSGDSRSTASTREVDAVSQLLQDEDALRVARLMIPELRTERTTPSEHLHRQRLLSATQQIRIALAYAENASQAAFDTALYT